MGHKPEVDKLILQGYSARDIESRTGVPESTVRSYAKKYGLTLAKWGNPELDKNIGILAGDGYGSESIAAILGITRKTVIRRAKLAGIVLPARSKNELINHAGFAPGVTEKAADKKRLTITWSGGTETLAEAGKRLGVHPDTIYWRIRRWGVERAMTTPRLQPFHSMKEKKPRKVADTHPWRKKKEAYHAQV